MNATVNTLKLIATVLVAVCHCWIICNQEFGFELQDNWQILLKTPAWGGVFMFFTISGYLAQSSISKYVGVNFLQFYKNKVKKILLPCFIFISLVYLLIEPTAHIDFLFLLKLLTCTFNGTGSPIHHIGATWYVFVLMWLFALCPFIYKMLDYIVNKYQGKKGPFLSRLFVAISVFGFAYRILGRLLGLEWYSCIYASVVGNLDLFIGGMIVARMPHLETNISLTIIKRMLFLALAILIVLCSGMYYYGEKNMPTFLSIYRYLTPSIYLTLTSFILWITRNETHKTSIVNILAPYTFEFYLWHSVVYSLIARNIMVENDFARYLLVLFGGIVITSYLAFIMTKMNAGIYKTKK